MLIDLAAGYLYYGTQKVLFFIPLVPFESLLAPWEAHWITWVPTLVLITLIFSLMGWAKHSVARMAFRPSHDLMDFMGKRDRQD